MKYSYEELAESILKTEETLEKLRKIIIKQNLDTSIPNDRRKWIIDMHGNKRSIPDYNLEEGKITVATYNIRIESLFILTQDQVKKALGHGYKISSIELDKEEKPKPITSVDTASQAILKAGYRALAYAHHPDFGGDVNTMALLNKAKKELEELLKAVSEVV